MTEIQKERLDLLFSLGLKFNGESYVGHGENSDFNFHYTEIMYDDDEIWNDKMNKIKMEIRRRALSNII